MRWFLLAFVVGCGGKSEDSTETTTPSTGGATTATGEPTTPTGPAPELASPAEATDLDPDPAVVRVELVAATHDLTVGDEVIAGYAYNGQVPGPTIRARLGDVLEVELTNQLSDPTTIHWHGVHVPWDMDGVTWMADPVDPGETFTYRFTLEQTGTFWYHPHFDTAHQVDHGLYGVLVVEDPTEPLADLDEVWVFDSWGEEAWAEGDHHTPDPTARTWTVNSLVGPVWRAPAGAAARVRLLNASNAGYLSFETVRKIAGDQGLAAAVVDGPLLLAPGDRAEVELSPSAMPGLRTEPWSAAGGPSWGEPIDLVGFEATAGGGGGPVSWPVSGAAPTPDPGWTDVRWSLNGGGEGPAGWTINGEAFPSVTIPQLPVGQPAVVELRNLSAAEHPFHLHGMSFEVLSIDGVAPPVRTVEDTVNLRIGEIARLLVQPPREGDWMAHCHILPHAEGGMMTVVTVTP